MSPFVGSTPAHKGGVAILAAGFEAAAGSRGGSRAFKRPGDEPVVDAFAAAEINPRYL